MEHQKHSFGLPEADWEALSERCKLRSFENGEVVLSEGQHHNSVFFLQSGKLHATKTAIERGTDRLEVVIVPGETFGEIGVFDPETGATSSVKAVQASTAWEISGGDLVEFCRENREAGLELLLKFCRQLSSRLRESVNTAGIR